MSKIKGITCGTYLNRRIKNSKNKKLQKSTICSNCQHKNICKYKNISKFSNGKTFSNNVDCEYFYFSITPKAILTLGRDKSTGKIIRLTFSGESEEAAFNKALNEKLKIDKSGGFKPLSKSNKTIVDIVSNIIDEDYKLGKIKGSTRKRKLDTLKQLKKQKFANKPIVKVSREEIVTFLESLKHYSKSTIKQNYELLCMAFGQASYEHIITDNFLMGWKRIEKPKSEYESNHRISLTIDEQKTLVNYLKTTDYKDCRHKYLFLLLLTTGIRIGEALALDYEKDIDLINDKLYIRRTQTRDENGKAILGDSTKTFAGQRTLNMNNLSKQIVTEALNNKLPNRNHLLFCKKDKTMYLENSINSSLKRIALKLNLGIYKDYDKNNNLVDKTYLHTHMLRGTFATRCAEAKIAPVVLKKILGHSDIEVTMKYYVDVDNEFEKSENKNVEEYLKNKDIFGIDFNL